jgi:hypothetical protein
MAYLHAHWNSTQWKSCKSSPQTLNPFVRNPKPKTLLAVEMGRGHPPWWADDGPSTPEALESFSTHSRDDPSAAPVRPPFSRQGLPNRAPFLSDGPSTSGREESLGDTFLDQSRINMDIRTARKLHRYDTPRPGDLEMPPPSQLLASVMLESIELQTLELPKPEVSPSERVARSLLSAGEILYVFRPLIYVLAMRKWGSKKWKPWLLSLGVDAASMALIAAADRMLQKEGRGKGKEGEAGLTEQERSEVRAVFGTSSFPLKHVLMIT